MADKGKSDSEFDFDEAFPEGSEDEYHFEDDAFNLDDKDEFAFNEAEPLSEDDALIKNPNESYISKIAQLPTKQLMLVGAIFGLFIVFLIYLVMQYFGGSSTEQFPVNNAPVAAAPAVPLPTTPVAQTTTTSSTTPATVSATTTTAITPEVTSTTTTNSPVGIPTDLTQAPLIMQPQTSTQTTVTSTDTTTQNADVQTLETQNQILEKRIENLEAQLAQINTNTGSSQDSAGIESRINNLENALDKVDGKVSQVNKALQIIVSAVMAPPTTTSYTVVSGHGPSNYFIQAIIPGRAWLRDQEGHTISVALGEVLPGYGNITQIDTVNGIVFTSSGLKVVYGNVQQ